jgi:hypothetical protein
MKPARHRNYSSSERRAGPALLGRSEARARKDAYFVPSGYYFSPKFTVLGTGDEPSEWNETPTW